MYLYYIYLLIAAMMDLLSDEIPPKFLRATTSTMPDFEQGWWSVCVQYGLLDMAWREKDQQDEPFGPVPVQNNGE